MTNNYTMRNLRKFIERGKAYDIARQNKSRSQEKGKRKF